MPRPDGRAGAASRLGVVLACVLIGACASRPAPETGQPGPIEPPPANLEEPAPGTEPTPVPEARPAPEPQSQPGSLPCAWSRTRGIATLLAIAESQRQGTWQFFPGDDLVFHPAPESASAGDEFKALLRRPMSGNCEEPELVLFGPV
ncbi:MAG: hypothetical protein R3280_00985 [Marinobacter sp.]|uniref:hypothetical protein n=1 Tax=Marinobacter sp. TaxID=50741 RepID=UPI00299EE6C4|nr:hypothetical protein [Marinobacter sp.]MDX1633187.1 hypothetical protein [Marinobacter sp.]